MMGVTDPLQIWFTFNKRVLLGRLPFPYDCLGYSRSKETELPRPLTPTLRPKDVFETYVHLGHVVYAIVPSSSVGARRPRWIKYLSMRIGRVARPVIALCLESRCTGFSFTFDLRQWRSRRSRLVGLRCPSVNAIVIRELSPCYLATIVIRI